MKFIYTGGEYTEFRGYVFAYGKARTIMDKGTEEALLKRDDFRRVDNDLFGETQESAPVEGHRKEKTDAPETAETHAPVLSKYACPKCGAIVRQGRYMHIKYCKGDEI